MKLDEPVAVLVQSICAEWNRAERAIKIAEQVIGEDPYPSIKELRYAGRRIIEAFAHLGNGEDNAALGTLQDAYFDCLRAKHDAMDVAVNEIAGRISFAQADLGAAVVVSAFPEFPKLVKKLVEFENSIALSRQDRTIRDQVYETIQENFDTVLKLYDSFKTNEEIMMADADAKANLAAQAQKSKKHAARGNDFLMVSSFLFAAILSVVTVLELPGFLETVLSLFVGQTNP